MTLSYIFIERNTPKGPLPMPYMPIKIGFGGRVVETLALLDTGADYSLIPRKFAEGLGINCNTLSKTTTKGVGSECDVGEVDVTIEFGQRAEMYHSTDVPFHVLLDSQQDCPILIGRVPLFYDFQICFRMGFCEDKGKFTLKYDPKKRDGSRYTRKTTWD